MARKFVNPQGTFAEEVGIGDSIFTLFFGAIALASYGLWGHAFIYFFIIFVSIFIHPGLAVLAWIFLTFVYTFLVSDLRSEKLLRDGWNETTIKEGSFSNETKNVNSKSDPNKPWRSFNDRPEIKEESEIPAIKQCPFCAEDVKFEAIKCKHCGSDLPPNIIEKDENTPRVLT